MNTYFSKIPITAINNKESLYHYSFPNQPGKQLIESIKNNGMFSPILLKKNESDNYQIISGFKRFEAAKILSYEHVDAYIVDNNTFEKNAELSLNDNLAHRTLNIFEISNFLELLKNQHIGAWHIIEQWMPKLGHKGHETLLKRFLRLQKIPKNLWNILLQKNYAMKPVYWLSGLSVEEQNQLVNLIVELSFNQNVFLEVAENLKAVSLKEKKNISEVIQEIYSHIRANNPDESHDTVYFASRFREEIKKLRFIQLYEYRKQIDKEIELLELPPSIKLVYDPLLEKHELSLIITIKSLQDTSLNPHITLSEPLKEGIERILQIT